jgi:hypothetical protein
VVNALVAAHIRDLRLQFGDPEQLVVESCCGCVGRPHLSPHAERLAKRDGTKHVDRERPSQHGQKRSKRVTQP